MKIKLLLFGILLSVMGALHAVGYDEVMAAFASGNIQSIRNVLQQLNGEQQVFYLSLPAHRHIPCDQLGDVLKPGVCENVNNTPEIEGGSGAEELNLTNNNVDVPIHNNQSNRFIAALQRYPLRIVAGISVLSSIVTLGFNQIIITRKKEQEKQKQEKKEQEKQKQQNEQEQNNTVKKD